MPNTAAETPVHVAVGILLDRGRVFITRRPPDAHQGGKWEFPGGKVAPGESVFAALRRELHEELGVVARDARPCMEVRHAYPGRAVLLDVWRVTAWDGTPHGREGQDAQWVACTELPRLEFPAADAPILRRLWLPALYFITDSRRFGEREFPKRLERALRAGARLVQLREPHLAPAEYQAYARDMAGLCHRYGAKLLINAEPGWVSACGADGAHLNSRRLKACSRRPLGNEYWVAVSCHNAGELERARRIEADFAVLGPVAPTASHPETVPLGWDGFRQLCAAAGLPAYALGGMRVPDLERARNAGAQGLALISGIWGADSIEQAVAALVPR